MSQHRIPVNRIAWILKLGRAETRRYCEAAGYAVSEDGHWVSSSDALEAVRRMIETQEELEAPIQTADPELSTFMKLFVRMSSRRRRAITRKYARELNEQPASEST